MKKGSKHSEKAKRRMSEMKKGKTRKPFSIEHRKRISENNYWKGKTGYWKGKKREPFSEETKRRMSESKKGQNNPNFGKELSEEHRKRIGENSARYWKGKVGPTFGRKHSEETKIKMALARQKYQEKNFNTLRNISKNYFTDIERIFKEFLEKYDIEYSYNERIGFYFPDFIIFDNVIIECDGDFWHSEENKFYSKDKEEERDKCLEDKGYLVFHLSEKEIRNNLKSAFCRILKEIIKRRERKGK